ncbi:NOL1/NOP2/sun family putative RNA methylase [archaeon]|jgi:tRNA (cytosine49-C5)-methyltransferase|nr:NOL1/NOP2/sun family putative RNA methylase [archaeon]
MKQRKIPEPKPLFVERIEKLLPDKKDREEYWKITKTPSLTSIRCNTLKISPEKLIERLKKYNWKINQPWKDYPEVIVVKGKKPTGHEKEILIKKDLAKLSPGELGRTLEHLLGYYYVQELASMLPIIALHPKEDELVLDLCAAPGSKTTQSSAMMSNTGTIIANEVSMGRMRILASNLERCGATNTIITRKEGRALSRGFEKYNIKFDKILVDAPCSGEGTLRSSIQTYIMWNPKSIKSLSHLQKQLFYRAFEQLKVKGELVYSTCTHAPEENEEVINSMLHELKDKIEIIPIKLPIKTRPGITKWDGKTYNEKVKLGQRVYPQDNNTEGFFVSKFRKVKE